MKNWTASRGFTLLELLISVLLLAVLLSAAVPSFSTLNTTVKMKRVANELMGFMLQSRSEAIMRSRVLWVHIVERHPHSQGGGWRLILTDSESAAAGKVIMVLDGQAFKSVGLDWNYSRDRIKFDGLRGRVNNGSLNFYVVSDDQQVLRLKSSFSANRIMLCGIGEKQFGYPAC